LPLVPVTARGLFHALAEEPVNTTTTTIPAATAAGSYGWPPPAHCPGHRLALSGGPVVFHCPPGRLGHRVIAADLDEAAGAIAATEQRAGAAA
jgi:hypothetical protein